MAATGRFVEHAGIANESSLVAERLTSHQLGKRSAFGIDRTSNAGDDRLVDTEALVVDAFAQLGIEARSLVDAPDRGIDLVLDPNGIAARIEVKRRSLVSDDAARRMLAETVPADAALLVVADRVTEVARRLLTVGRGGYLDLRGHVALHTDRIVIDADVEPVKERAGRSDALGGPAGLEVAAALLMRPGQPTAVRGLARELGRSPGTVSEILAALRRDEVIDAKNAVTDTRLFWELAERWHTPRTYLARAPAPGEVTMIGPLRLGLDDVEHTSGWALTDSAAAAAYDAPLAFRSGQVLDFLVPDQSIVRRATTLLGSAGSASSARATVRVPPVPAAVQRRVDLAGSPLGWPLAHPLFVALDLALDAGRGREVLEAWTPEERWSRVW